MHNSVYHISTLWGGGLKILNQFPGHTCGHVVRSCVVPITSWTTNIGDERELCFQSGKRKVDNGHIELVELPDHCQLWRRFKISIKVSWSRRSAGYATWRVHAELGGGLRAKLKILEGFLRFEAQCGLCSSVRTLQIVGLLGFWGIRMNSIREFVGYHIMVGDWGSERWVAFVW
jgi:hypothetical protein